ncbi:unnamed protein product [Caenorhabditis auriculariae]|uniref:CSD domain-containing protein n=1 Tax=Caenorhabditis auriculariae TaxID=2777116 RepID=A0A8S1GMM6_9PELO|nr:unnamed protein product [Caenorhabditis auriculariae]
MSTSPIEVAEEALENHLENLKIVDENNGDNKTEDEPKKRKYVSREERARMWLEELKDKKVLETGLKGKVKWYSVLGRYGFIARDDEEKDVFVHQSAISKSLTNKLYLRTLANEEEVEFDIVEGKKGPEAANVSGPGGDVVKGSKYRRILLSQYQKRRRSSKEHEGEVEQPLSDEQGEKSAGEEKQADGPIKRRRNNKNRRQHRNRRNKKNNSEAIAESEEKSSEEDVSASEQNKEAQPATRRSAEGEDGSNKEQTGIPDRCESAMSVDASLGAQSIEGQI